MKQQRIYIIGICGTFMGGIARLAREAGITVSGSDANTYPPMSTQLQSLEIELFEGYRAENIDLDADIIVIGNTISRGNPELEYVLENNLPYVSGAQWLYDNLLLNKWVLAVSGTHGKTTTSSMLAWILADNSLQPGFLIGGVPENFGVSSRLGESDFFVIEADEYDTAFSDKRSKFIHYHPRTLVINNLEFDHADIFADLAAIQTQFHHLLKIMPATGLVIHNQQSHAIDEVLGLGCWSNTQSFATSDSQWQCNKLNNDASQFEISFTENCDNKNETSSAIVEWPLIGEHNMHNALAAIAAAHHAGVSLAEAAKSLGRFKSVKRRLELIYSDKNVHVYDDFAHHPTAITETLAALRSKVGDERIIAVLEPRSNTMRQGVHKEQLGDSLVPADQCLIYADDNVQWDIAELNGNSTQTFNNTDNLLMSLLSILKPNDHVLIMSNGGFEGLHQRLIEHLENRSLNNS